MSTSSSSFTFTSKSIKLQTFRFTEGGAKV